MERDSTAVPGAHAPRACPIVSRLLDTRLRYPDTGVRDSDTMLRHSVTRVRHPESRRWQLDTDDHQWLPLDASTWILKFKSHPQVRRMREKVWANRLGMEGYLRGGLINEAPLWPNTLESLKDWTGAAQSNQAEPSKSKSLNPLKATEPRSGRNLSKRNTKALFNPSNNLLAANGRNRTGEAQCESH
ncbi:hypothetical protein F0562_031828 [Nyssa sinensis]|uniref:Uncharacterized protein n=1 Tax=Nyssa sinensis TaxID=561372 RepID=A0A5J5ATD8_9ASTE|nr:hypothetical protein F0562_031828 [Nyssa sinensis]